MEVESSLPTQSFQLNTYTDYVLERALHGLIGPHQRMVMQCQLRHLNFLDDEIAGLDKEVARRMDPFEESIQQIDDIPGIATRTAQVILGEIGLDMTFGMQWTLREYGVLAGHLRCLSETDLTRRCAGTSTTRTGGGR